MLSKDTYSLENMITVVEYAALHHVPLQTVYTWLKVGKLKDAYKNEDGNWLIDKNAIVPYFRPIRTRFFSMSESEVHDENR